MPLYHVQDNDRPLWVMADDFAHAVRKWRTVIAAENEQSFEETEEPQGVTLICDDNELVVGLSTVRQLGE